MSAEPIASDWYSPLFTMIGGAIVVIRTIQWALQRALQRGLFLGLLLASTACNDDGETTPRTPEENARALCGHFIRCEDGALEYFGSEEACADVFVAVSEAELLFIDLEGPLATCLPRIWTRPCNDGEGGFDEKTERLLEILRRRTFGKRSALFSVR